MANAFTTWFDGKWDAFLNWFGSAEAAVVAEGKTIVDELVPVFKADLLQDGSQLLTTTTAALATGTGLVGIAAGATALLPVLAAQGITLSKEAAAVLAAFVSAKIAAAQAANPPAPASSASGTAA